MESATMKPSGVSAAKLRLCLINLVSDKLEEFVGTGFSGSPGDGYCYSIRGDAPDVAKMAAQLRSHILKFCPPDQ